MESFFMIRRKLIEEIASKFKAIGLPPELNVRESKFLVALLHEVAKGNPVTHEKINEIATQLNFNEVEIKSFIEAYTERDQNEKIVGVFGLSQNKYAHKFDIEDNNLSTFCGWDTLFLTQLLKKTAKIEVIDPQSKETVRLEISPQKVVTVSPSNTVLSIVVPGEDIETMAQAYNIFCVNIRFFASEKNLHDWFKQREYKPLVISPQEGFELGSLSFGHLMQKVEIG
ncbi:MAG: organomercurial lyase [Candidatus Heimdallarchaeota archaeon]